MFITMNHHFIWVLCFSIRLFQCTLALEINETYYWLTILANDYQTIQLNGFDAENHQVLTPDGYLIQIFRVINPKRNTNRNGYPIVLFSGLTQESHTYYFNTNGWFNRTTGIYVEYENRFRNRLEIQCPPLKVPTRFGRNIAFTLATCGFDVWLANVRDDKSHASHLFLNHNDSAYWNITLDDYTVDVGAILDYILDISRSNTLGVICFSVSCNSVFQLMIEHRRFNHLIKPLFNMAPFIYFHNMLSLPLLFFSSLESVLRNILQSTPDLNPILPYLANQVKQNKFLRIIYIFCLTLFGGLNPEEFSQERLYQMVAHFPSITAIRVYAHVGQRYRTDKLYKYDYGSEQNLIRYGNSTPPYYDISKVTNSYMVLWHGTRDLVADSTDIELLQRTLTVFQTNYGHIDFVFARSMNVTVVRPMLITLNRLNLNYN